MPDQRPLIERVLDVVVYAPIGLLGQLQQEVPKFAAEGRQKFENRVQVARFIGEMSVTFGRKELAKRISERQAATTAAVSVEAASSGQVRHNADAPAPFDGYDTMAAAHIVQQMRSMTPAELDAVAEYERQHRNRRTVLAKVDQLRAG
jgi:hypothetical protein